MDPLLQRLENAYRLLYGRRLVSSRLDFAQKLGKTQTQISDAFKERPGRLTKGLMKTIADAFPDDINREYMITGEGGVEKIDTLGGIPHFTNLSVAAGYFDGFEIDTNDIEIRKEPYGMGDAEFSIDVEGFSMYPEIQPGDTLYLKQHLDTRNLPMNRIVVVLSKEGGGVVKRLTEENQKTLYLQSLNPDYDDIEMPRADIHKIYRVIGITRNY